MAVTHKSLLSVEDLSFYDENVLAIFKGPKDETESWLKEFFGSAEHSESLKRAICSVAFRFSPAGNWGYGNLPEPALYKLIQVLPLSPGRLKAASRNENFSEKTIRHILFVNTSNGNSGRNRFIRVASPKVMTLSVLSRLLETVKKTIPESTHATPPFLCFSESILRERIAEECEAKRVELDSLGMPDSWIMKMFSNEPEIFNLTPAAESVEVLAG